MAVKSKYDSQIETISKPVDHLPLISNWTLEQRHKQKNQKHSVDYID